MMRNGFEAMKFECNSRPTGNPQTADRHFGLFLSLIRGATVRARSAFFWLTCRMLDEETGLSRSARNNLRVFVPFVVREVESRQARWHTRKRCGAAAQKKFGPRRHKGMKAQSGASYVISVAHAVEVRRCLLFPPASSAEISAGIRMWPSVNRWP